MRTRQAESHGLKHAIKKFLLPAGASVRTIQTGALAGLRMDLNLLHQSQRWLGLEERELNGWLRRLSVGIRTALDVGANTGMYTLYFLSKTGAQTVIAFEPAIDVMEQLRKNLASNGFEGETRLKIETRPVGATPNGQDVALDSYLNEIRFPCLVKVDIDGGEAALLEGARKLLAVEGVRWIIEVHSAALQQQCLNILRQANYRVVVVRNAWWRNFLPELRPGELNHWIVALRGESS
jgi:hypothetical protein